jgi:type IV pilus assembly protein PilM
MGQTAPAGQTPATGTAPATGATAAALAVADADPGPKGPGWIIEIRGHHFYNRMRATEGVVHLRKTFIQNLQSGKVTLPIEFGNGPGSPTKFDDFTMKELGIGYVLVADSEPIDPFFEIANPDYIDPQNVDDVGRDKKLPAADDPNNKPAWRLPKYSFVIQFVWKEKLLRDRLKERKDKELQAQLDAEKAAAAAQNPAAATTTPPAPPATK